MSLLFPFELNFAGSCVGEEEPLVRIGDCQWSLACVAHSAFPGFSSEVHGVLGIGPAGVSGRLDYTWTEEPGFHCRATTLLGHGLAP